MQIAAADRRPDFFIAHAGADAEVAKRLAALLEAGGASVFLDTEDLLPGDMWPRVLAQAQDNSAVTVILVSNFTANAQYELEELAEAVEMSRYGEAGHRVAPVYLEHVDRIPYGLRVVHGLWALDDAGLGRAAGQLLRLLPRVGSEATGTLWGPRVPPKRPVFGRDELLGRLASQRPQGAPVLIQSVAGSGGVGKSTLAAALCWEQDGVVDIVWWLRAETDTTLIQDLADLAGELGLPAGGEDLAVEAERACRELEREERSWLLVFDNADSTDLVYRFAPRRGHGRVIVTTRRRDFGRLGPVTDVDVFDEATSEAFLRSLVRDSNPAAVNETAAGDVARCLGGLPLALEQAGAYVAYSPRRSFAAYLGRLDDAGLDPFVDGKPLDYQATATTTWKVSIDAAARRAPLAPKVMAALAYLAAAPVPLALFADPVLAAHPYLAATAAQVTEAVDELYAYSLVTIDSGTLAVHRVIREAARRGGDPAASRFVVDSLRHVHPRDVDRGARWALCAVLLPHVLNVAATASTADPDTAATIIWLLDRAATALRYAGAAAQAIPLLERAAGLAVEVHGADHPDTLQSRHDLAAAYLRAGRTTEAVTLNEANLADRQRVLGSDHPDALQSRSSLAGAYLEAGRIAEAITLDEITLADRKRVLGPDHPDTLQSRSNLAVSYRAARRVAEAITLDEATVADRRRVLGTSHPDTLTSCSNLAAGYWAAGRTAEAITLDEATVADRRRVLGPDHPDVFQSRSNLALDYWAAGRMSEAISLFEATVADRQRVLGPDHPDTLESLTNLAAARRQGTSPKPRSGARATRAPALDP